MKQSDRIKQLEERIVMLEARLAAVEARAIRHVPTWTAPPNWWLPVITSTCNNARGN